MKNKRAALVVGVGLAGLALYLVTRAKAAPSEGAAASVTIEVLGAESHSPIELLESESYTVRVTVTNQSIKAGVPCEATLDIFVTAGSELVRLIPDVLSRDEYFAAEQTRAFEYLISVPIGMLPGDILAEVYDPAGEILARAFEYFTIISIEITYAATVSIGV